MTEFESLQARFDDVLREWSEQRGQLSEQRAELDQLRRDKARLERALGGRLAEENAAEEDRSEREAPHEKRLMAFARRGAGLVLAAAGGAR